MELQTGRRRTMRSRRAERGGRATRGLWTTVREELGAEVTDECGTGHAAVSQPLITPMGRMRATFFDRPAR